MRGLDIFELAPSGVLTENEIAAAALGDQGDTFNPQQQYPVTWPDHPVVALAYLDQLNREGALEVETATAMAAALGQARALMEAGESDSELSQTLADLSEDLSGVDADGRNGARLTALRNTLTGIAAGLE